MRFAADGANPDVVDRCTLYNATPVLSADAVHDRVAEPSPPFAVSAPGAVGGMRSAAPVGSRTDEATDGTPFEPTRNSM